MTDPIHPASGDLEARKAVALVLLRGKTGALADMILGLPEAQERGLEILTDAILSALRPADPVIPTEIPAVVGEAIGPGGVDDEWAERYCEAVNWSPDGQECKTVEGEFRCTTFRQIAKGHILAAIATQPGNTSPPAHDPALIARVRAGVEKAATVFDIYEDAEEAAALRALLADLDAGAGR